MTTSVHPHQDRPFPMKSSQRYWLCQWGGWGGVFLLSAVVAFISAAGTADALDRMRKDILFTGLTCAGGLVVSHGMRNLMVFRHWMLRTGRELWLRLGLAWGAGTLVLCAFSHWLMVTLMPAVTAPPLIACLMMSGLLLGMWTCVYVLYHIQEAWNLSRLRESQLRTSRIEAQIAALQAQTTPHFLFNALNVIRALLPLDATLAREAITSLAALLRSCLVEGRRRGISLAEDLEIMRNYLGIERLRFESTLGYEEHLDPEVLQLQVPPLLCLTLAENAVKHGIQNHPSGGTLRLSARRQDSTLEIRLDNPGGARSIRTPDSLGLGLQNLADRVRLIHGEGSSVSLSHDPGTARTQVLVRLRLDPRSNPSA